MKRETLFISDLHLTPQRPATLQRFLRFLAERAARAERLYILGDLFDAYLGDDDLASPNREVRSALKRLTASGTQVFFQPGNRDFLLGEGFGAATGVELLGDYTVIDLYGTPALLTHGDLLCTDDVQYQAARQKVRSPEWRRYALGKPLWMRRLYARWYRFKSTLDKSGKHHEIMDANPNTVITVMQAFGVHLLIHGHTHRPGLSQHGLGTETGIRIVLPEWDDRETVLCWNHEGYRQEPLDSRYT